MNHCKGVILGITYLAYYRGYSGAYEEVRLYLRQRLLFLQKGARRAYMFAFGRVALRN